MNYLPVSIDLKYKKILVFGGGIVAYRKIKLLLKFNAIIRIISKKISSKLFIYIKKKKITWISKIYSKKYFKNIFLVIIATNDKKLNKKIFKKSNKNKILTNTVDNKKLCSFIFPSIIERKPILISISSQGKSPTLARIIKKKIEKILPINFGNIAILSGKFRNIIKLYTNNFFDRKFFWERLFNSNFIDEIINNRIKRAIEFLYHYLLNNIFHIGKVVLLGSGPGDSDLLTIKGFHILQKADVVIYDYLISRDILNWIRKDAKTICVGKRFGLKSIKQDKINKLLIHFAKDGKFVVRLKGGDSYIFGRGAEEIISLKKEGIKFQVIPGITSAIGISAYTGIPLTYRNYSSNVLFLTANSGNYNIKSKELNIIPNKPKTLVIYMCKTKIGNIFQELLIKGYSLNTSIALINFGTLFHQNFLYGKLKNIFQLSSRLDNPLLLIIGKVVNLHKKLSWFCNSNFDK